MDMRIIKFTLILILSGLSFFCFSQRFNGFVKDANNGELLIGATVASANSECGTITNANGYFSLLCNSDSVIVSFVGYQKKRVKWTADSIVSIYLKPGQEIEEVVIFAQRQQKFNTTTLSIHELKTIPSLGGTPDLLKTLQLMPGIQSQAEGTSHINVRGGNPGENLYLIDDVPLMYVNHLGGFLSVFNPDMINTMEVYKGGFPAKYGGKLSSIMAINQREGNSNKWKGSVGLGISAASFSVEGPLLKDKASLIVTGRKTLIDYPMMLLSILVDQDFIVYYGFHDINGKISFRPNSKNSFHINLYQGDDYLNYQTDYKNRDQEVAKIRNTWGNWMLSGRWSRVVSPRLFVNNILSTTNYRLKVAHKYASISTQDTLEYQSRYFSRVNDFMFRSDWQYKLTPNYSIDFGAKASIYKHVPNKIEQSKLELAEFEQVYSIENVLYTDHNWSFWDKVYFDMGLRFVSFMNDGFSTYAFEPRVNVNVQMFPTQALNFNFQRVNQFSHLLLTSGVILNNEIWVPSDKSLLPSQSRQVSVGWKGSFKNRSYNAELNVYDKELKNLASYKEGYSNLLGDGGWRSKIESGGTGKSRGIEFFVKKNKGNWTGFIAYTYSKTTRRFENINSGKEYVFAYDRPHSGSINLNRKLSEKWSASFTWVYQSGLPYTPVVGRQYTLNLYTFKPHYEPYDEALIYGERNSARMQNYHRMDLGFICKKITKKGRKAEWNISVYNVYNRRNPTAYYYSGDKTDPRTLNFSGEYMSFKKFKVSLFPLIPMASYTLYFE
jgi:hypothetical protein